MEKYTILLMERLNSSWNIKKNAIMNTKQNKIILFIFTTLFSVNIYSQSNEQSNIISVKKDVFSTLLLNDNNSFIFNQDKPTSHLFNNHFSDYNIGYQRKIGKRFFIGADYYNFDAFNDIAPITLNSTLTGFERDRFVAKTNMKIVRISGHYTVLDKEEFAIKANLYIPIFERYSKDLTLVYHLKEDKEKLSAVYVSDINKKFYIGIVRPEISVDFLYKLPHIEAGISTSWNSMLTPNEPVIRCSAVLNILF